METITITFKVINEEIRCDIESKSRSKVIQVVSTSSKIHKKYGNLMEQYRGKSRSRTPATSKMESFL